MQKPSRPSTTCCWNMVARLDTACWFLILGVLHEREPLLAHSLQAALTQLRKIAAIRGLVNDGVRALGPCHHWRRRCRLLPAPGAGHPHASCPLQLRARVWPLLLGVDTALQDAAEYEERHGSSHKDSHVVSCDMARSLWSFTEGAARHGAGPLARRAAELWHAFVHPHPLQHLLWGIARRCP
jgi:hypothetical protein